jgi:ribosome biogenesis GTPase A
MHDLKKPLVLVLTKVDLVPAENVHRWMKFFEENFPGLRVTPFASYEKKDSDGKIMLGMKKKKRHAGKLHFFPTGAGPFMKLISSFGIKKHGM